MTKELLAVFLVTTTVLLLVGIGGRFIGYLQEAVLGKYAADILLTLISLRLPEFLQLTIPFAYFLAVVLTTSRWYADHEMTAIIAGGGSPARVLLWVMTSGVVLSAVVATLTFVLTPVASIALADVFSEQRQAREFQGITPGVFHSFSSGKRVTYSENMSEDKSELIEVFLSEQRSSGAEVLIWADKGTQYYDASTGSRFLLLEDGFRYEGTPGTSEFRIVQFETLSQRVNSSPKRANRTNISALSTQDLLVAPGREAKAELHWRLSLPLMTLITGLCGFVVSRVKPRAGRFAMIVPALVVIMTYYLLLLATRHALSTGSLSELVGFWPVHLLFLVGGLIALKLMSRPAVVT
ncbi:MAG: LPS export ABC transporter permease LptF [Pseudomonadales bacterium]|nr:LPS export ABC transporter permease LptF [Pseudomonadales bacterium]